MKLHSQYREPELGQCTAHTLSPALQISALHVAISARLAPEPAMGLGPLHSQWEFSTVRSIEPRCQGILVSLERKYKGDSMLGWG